MRAWFIAAALATTPVQAQVYESFSVDGPASGFRQSFTLELTGANILSAQLYGTGEFQKLWYDPDIDIITGNEYIAFDECTTAAGCGNYFLSGFALNGNIARFSITTPRGYDDCDSVDLSNNIPYADCALSWFFTSAQLDVEADVPGGVFRLTPGALVAVPEPSAWALLIAGFGVIGTALRASRVRPVLQRPRRL